MADSPPLKTDFKLGERVEIAGRTMLRPGFSLVGLTGVVFAPAPNLPDGCLTVAIDWPAHGYNEESGYPDGSLPLFVNVPAAHLIDPDAPEEARPKAKFESKSQLSQLLGKSAPKAEIKSESAIPSEAAPEAESEKLTKNDGDADENRPRLRLV